MKREGSVGRGIVGISCALRSLGFLLFSVSSQPITAALVALLTQIHSCSQLALLGMPVFSLHKSSHFTPTRQIPSDQSKDCLFKAFFFLSGDPNPLYRCTDGDSPLNT